MNVLLPQLKLLGPPPAPAASLSPCRKCFRASGVSGPTRPDPCAFEGLQSSCESRYDFKAKPKEVFQIIVAFQTGADALQTGRAQLGSGDGGAHVLAVISANS